MLIDQYGTFSIRTYFNFFIISLLALGVYIGTAFPSFSERTTAGSFLLFPASNFEKLLSQFLLYIIAGMGILVALFWIDAHLVRLSLSHLESVRVGKFIIIPFSYSSLINCINTIFGYEARDIGIKFISFFIMIIISVAGFLFTTRLFFRRFALAKSIFCAVLLIFSLPCLLVVCSHLFLPGETQGFIIQFPSYKSLWGLYNYELLLYGLLVIICIFFLPLAYFKLKEKQL
jgi:hypothetical protein